MSWKVLKENKPLLALMIVSIFVIPSILMGTKVVGIVFLLFVIVWAWCLRSYFGVDFIKKNHEALWGKGEENREKNRHITSAFYQIAAPLMAVGALIMLFTIYLLIFEI